MTDERPRGLHIATVSGVPVYVGYSWGLIALVLVLIVGPRIADQRPDLGVLAYGVGVGFAILLLAAVLVHEAAHAVVARRFGMPVVRVVADLWGGHTAFDAARSTPGSAAAVAVAGPLANAALGLTALLLTGAVPDGVPHTLVEGFALLNGALAAFNLLPGLPLDGGQLVDSLVWKATGDRNRGMVVAGWCGRVLTIGVVLWFGVRPLLTGGDVFDIIWALFIGSFLWAGASAAITRGTIRGRMERLRTADVMYAATSQPEETVLAAVDPAARAHVVLDAGGRATSVALAEDIAQVPPHLRAGTPLSAVSRPQPPGWVVVTDPAGPLEPVLAAIVELNALVVAIAYQGAIVGVVLSSDVNAALERN
jgi:Zn-dependent protease